jgi:hypothetical protein
MHADHKKRRSFLALLFVPGYAPPGIAARLYDNI